MTTWRGNSRVPHHRQPPGAVSTLRLRLPNHEPGRSLIRAGSEERAACQRGARDGGFPREGLLTGRVIRVVGFDGARRIWGGAGGAGCYPRYTVSEVSSVLFLCPDLATDLESRLPC